MPQSIAFCSGEDDPADKVNQREKGAEAKIRGEKNAGKASRNRRVKRNQIIQATELSQRDIKWQQNGGYLAGAEGIFSSDKLKGG